MAFVNPGIWRSQAEDELARSGYHKEREEQEGEFTKVYYSLVYGYPYLEVVYKDDKVYSSQILKEVKLAGANAILHSTVSGWAKIGRKRDEVEEDMRTYDPYRPFDEPIPIEGGYRQYYGHYPRGERTKRFWIEYDYKDCVINFGIIPIE